MPAEKLLILDLDETLVHTSATDVRAEGNFQVFHYFVYQRPGLAAFLAACAQHFRLAIWSSASDDYVQAVVRQILPPGITLEFVWGRGRCPPPSPRRRLTTTATTTSTALVPTSMPSG